MFSLFSHFQLLVWSNKKVSNIIVSELAKKDSTTQCFVWMIKVRVLPWTYFLIIVPLTCHRRSIERTFWNLRCKPFQLNFWTWNSLPYTAHEIKYILPSKFQEKFQRFMILQFKSHSDLCYKKSCFCWVLVAVVNKTNENNGFCIAILIIHHYYSRIKEIRKGHKRFTHQISNDLN